MNERKLARGTDWIAVWIRWSGNEVFEDSIALRRDGTVWHLGKLCSSWRQIGGAGYTIDQVAETAARRGYSRAVPEPTSERVA